MLERKRRLSCILAGGNNHRFSAVQIRGLLVCYDEIDELAEK